MRLQRTFPALAALAALAAAAPAGAQPADDVRAAIEVLRSDVNGARVEALNAVLKLSTAEADKFWPLCREYEAELGALGDRKLALIREFARLQLTSSMDDATAGRLAGDWFDLQQARLDLWEKYFRRVKRELSAVHAAQFVQVEHQIALFLDLNIAAEMPLVQKAASATP